MRRLLACIFVLVVLGLVGAASVMAAAPSAPDASFATGGVAQIDGIRIDAIRVQADGMVLVAGARKVDRRFVPWLVRVRTDGALDASFSVGENGIVPLPEPGDGNVSDVDVLDDGRIVALLLFEGADGGEGRDILTRFLPDGRLDTSFSKDGYAPQSLREPWSRSTLHVDASSGRLAISMATVPFASLRMFNVDGSTDTEFGDNGIVRANLFDGQVRPPQSVGGSANTAGWALRPNGAVVLAGSTQWRPDMCGMTYCGRPGPPRQDHLFGFDADGNPDGALGGGHRVALAAYTEKAYANYGEGPEGQVHELADGRLVVVSTGVGAQIEIARFRRDGRRDRAFAGVGRRAALPALPSAWWQTIDTGLASDVDPSGRYLVADADRLVRILPGGRIDASFDPDSVWMPRGVTALDVAADGRIYWAAGDTLGALHGGSATSVVPRVTWTSPRSCGIDRANACILAAGRRALVGRVTPVPSTRRIVVRLGDITCGIDDRVERRLDVPIRSDGTFTVPTASFAKARRKWSIVAQVPAGGAFTDGASKPLNVHHPRPKCVRTVVAV